MTSPDRQDAPPGTMVVIGVTDVGRRACALMTRRGIRVRHLDEPSDADLRAALTSDVSAVAVLLHDDVRALRYSLVVEHVRPGIRLFVAMFDATARAQLERTVPNCVVLSPASIAVPSMVAAALDTGHAAIRRATSSSVRTWVAIDPPAGGHDASSDASAATGTIEPFRVAPGVRRRGVLGTLRGQLRPYDAGSAVLLGGALGLLLVIAVDTLVGLRHDSFIRALYDATRTTATISAPELADEPAVLAWATLAALLVMGFTAAFAAGIVHHLLSGRHVALVGRRVMPRSGHVIVVGMGQVGLRLAQELRALGVAVLGVERHSSAPGLSLARDLGIPVIIGDAGSRAILRRAGLSRSLALVAAGSEERDNIAVAIAAQAISPSTTLVIRAGSDDAIDETQSLFHIGPVVDVNGLTAAFVVDAITRSTPFAVVMGSAVVRGTLSQAGAGLVALADDGSVTGTTPGGTMRCSCA